MVSRLELYKNCVRKLKENGIDDAEFDAMCIFQQVFREKNPLFKPNEEAEDSQIRKAYNDVEYRCSGNPLQYILGEWDFWKYTFRVGEGVLIPRPDTETLIENVLDICAENHLKSPKILDLCSGSGCIAVTLDKEIPQSVVYAVEKYGKAFEYLTENIRLNDSDVKAVQADVLLAETAEKFRDFDIIVSNPPYLTADEMRNLQKEVQSEPSSALFGGSDGLDFYRAITENWRSSLRNGGYICYETGDGQHKAVADILKLNNFININFTEDTGGIIRTVTAEKQEEK
ncbi:MAG: peptide chain release factor N(5)-glutamine methyltransferase [Ruminococcus flavefaciens]|nr:peptide chain release factor N(5)-glutamine methyltransferase [Ruminococcus flavefaciens]MCM1228758.1 peptide chain release factor N(5)-glutamine methyltransferase [Ruminococcus flavefaciens]